MICHAWYTTFLLVYHGKNIILQHHRFAHFLFSTNNKLGSEKNKNTSAKSFHQRYDKYHYFISQTMNNQSQAINYSNKKKRADGHDGK